MNTLDLLLKADLETFKVPTKDVKVKRLSDSLNNEVIFTIKALSIDKLEELRATNSLDFSIHTVIEGVVAPDLRAKELSEKLSTYTPIDTVKKLLIAGEIDDLYNQISKLSGYGKNTIEEIKKK